MNNLYDQAEMDRQRDIGRAEGYQRCYDQTFNQARVDAKIAGLAEGREAGYAEGVKLGAESYRARVREILASDGAKGREKAAMSLALETDMPASDAISALRTMPSTSSIGARQAGTVKPFTH